MSDFVAKADPQPHEGRNSICLDTVFPYRAAGLEKPFNKCCRKKRRKECSKELWNGGGVHSRDTGDSKPETGLKRRQGDTEASQGSRMPGDCATHRRGGKIRNVTAPVMGPSQVPGPR